MSTTDRRPEIVRIDDLGTVRPVDKSAQQRLRAGKGSYRVVPSPPRFVLLERVAAEGARSATSDGGRPATGEPPMHLRVGGEIVAPGMLCDLVGVITQAGWRGELVVWSTPLEHEPIARSIFFEAGNVLGAQSTAPGERLGEIMFQHGALDRQQIADVARKVTPERRFGETAVDLGLITRERLFECVRAQTEEIFFQAIRAAEGTYWFVDAFDPVRLAYRDHVSAPAILMQAVRRLDEGKYFRTRIPSGAHVPVQLPTRAEPPGELVRVFRACDGRRSVLEVGQTCALPEFETTHALYQLSLGGFVQITSPRPSDPAAVVAIFDEAIRPILAAADATGRGAELRARLAAFATGVGVYDALFLGAGPAADGSLDPARVAQNLVALAGDDPTAALAHWLHDYLTFALFDATTEMPRAASRELTDAVSPRIALLAPANVPPSVAVRSERPAARSAAAPGHKPPPIPRKSPPPFPKVTAPVIHPALDNAVTVPNPAVAELSSSDLVPASAAEAPTPLITGEPSPPPKPSLPSLQQLPADEPPTLPMFGREQPGAAATPVLGRPLEPEPEPMWAAVDAQRARAARTRTLVRRMLTGIAVALLLAAGGGALVVSGVLGLPGGDAPTEPPKATIPKKPATTATHTAKASAPHPTSTPSASAPPVASPAPSPAPTTAPTASTPEPTAAGLSASQGRLITSKCPAGFRVFVDGKVVGNTPEPIVVTCGTRTVKVGSHGTPQKLGVPCGGELEVYAR